jgi:hypothetical protein
MNNHISTPSGLSIVQIVEAEIYILAHFDLRYPLIAVFKQN